MAAGIMAADQWLRALDDLDDLIGASQVTVTLTLSELCCVIQADRRRQRQRAGS